MLANLYWIHALHPALAFDILILIMVHKEALTTVLSYFNQEVFLYLIKLI